MLRNRTDSRLYELKQNVRKDNIANFLIIPRDGFLDISFVKDSSLFLHAIQSPFYWRILKKPTLSTKNPQKLESIHEKHFVEKISDGRKPVDYTSRTHVSTALQLHNLATNQYTHKAT